VTLRALTEERDPYLLGLLRLAFSTLLLLLTLKLAQPVWDGEYFGDFFHMPLVPESWVPSRSTYVALLVVQASCAVVAFLGVLARPALATGAMLALYSLLCDRLSYHNNRYQLMLLCMLVAVTPCDRSFSPFARARSGPAPRWAVTLVGAQISLVYLASSAGKLLDPDWRGGLVMLHRFSYGARYVERFLPSLAALLEARSFAHAASVVALATEISVAVGLWLPRTRAYALWLGVLLHAGIEAFAHVEFFSYEMLAAYLVFVTPELRQRALAWNDSKRAARLSALCRRLDILARFRHEISSGPAPLLQVTDRAGRVHEGLSAWTELARAFPPLFPLWLPLHLLTLGRSAVRRRALNPSSS